MPVITCVLGIPADMWTHGFNGVPELQNFGAGRGLRGEESEPREGRGFA